MYVSQWNSKQVVGRAQIRCKFIDLKYVYKIITH